MNVSIPPADAVDPNQPMRKLPGAAMTKPLPASYATQGEVTAGREEVTYAGRVNHQIFPPSQTPKENATRNAAGNARLSSMNSIIHASMGRNRLRSRKCHADNAAQRKCLVDLHVLLGTLVPGDRNHTGACGVGNLVQNRGFGHEQKEPKHA